MNKLGCRLKNFFTPGIAWQDMPRAADDKFFFACCANLAVDVCQALQAAKWQVFIVL